MSFLLLLVSWISQLNIRNVGEADLESHIYCNQLRNSTDSEGAVEAPPRHAPLVSFLRDEKPSDSASKTMSSERCCAPENMGHATPEFRGWGVYVADAAYTMSTCRNKGLKGFVFTFVIAA
jgi:hypothetical protein